MKTMTVQQILDSTPEEQIQSVMKFFDHLDDQLDNMDATKRAMILLQMHNLLQTLGSEEIEATLALNLGTPVVIPSLTSDARDAAAAVFDEDGPEDDEVFIGLDKLDIKPDSDNYYIVAVFQRSRADDQAVIDHTMKGDNLPFQKAATLQFTREMQRAYDDTGVSGHFQCYATVIGGLVEYVDPGRKTLFG